MSTEDGLSIEPALPSVYEFHLTRCDRVVAAVLRRIV